MSCTSVCYWYSEAGLELYSDNVEFIFEDSVTVPAETIPGYQICVPTWTSPYESCTFKTEWSKCATKTKTDVWGWSWSNCEPGWIDTYDCKWVKSQQSWCCCWTTPTVQLWPELTFKYKATVPTAWEVEVGYLVGQETPPEPFNCESITVYSFEFQVDINNGEIDETVTIPLGNDGEGIVFYAYNGTYFYAQQYLGGGTGTYKWDGFKYELDFDFYMLYCLEPEPPMTWINLQVECTMSVTYDDAYYSVTFTVACPLIPPS
jgi:hypothetical protein